jgi:hypothetical protein
MVRQAVDSAGVWKTLEPAGQRLFRRPRFPHPLENAGRVFHTVHSRDDDCTAQLVGARGGVGTFSIIKRVCFRASQFRQNRPGGSVFGHQVGTFSVDKNSNC